MASAAMLGPRTKITRMRAACRRGAGMLVALGLLASAFAAYGALAAGPGPQTTVIVGGDFSGIDSLDPQRAADLQGEDVVHQAYATLITFATGNMSRARPEIAQSWTLAADGTTWTFQLKHGVRFFNGDEVTADDVVYSLQRFVSLRNNPNSFMLTQTGIGADNVLQNITAASRDVVQIKTPKRVISPTAFLSVLSAPNASIVDAAVVKQHVSGDDWGERWLSTHSAGSGPYQLTAWSRDNQVVLDANPNYNLGPAPKIRRVIYQNVPEPTVQYDLLRKGNLDIAQDLTGEQLKALAGNPQIRLVRIAAPGMGYLALNTKTVPAFASRDVRQAIKYAIDYDGIVNNLLAGSALLLQGLVPKGLFGYDPRTPFSPRNVARAKTLLASGGYPNGFAVELLVGNGGMPGGIPGPTLAAKVQTDLCDIGVRVSIRSIEFAELLAIYRAQQAQMVMSHWEPSYADPDAVAKPLGDYNARSVAWRLSYENPTMISLVEHASVMPDNDVRASLYKEINQLAMTDGPVVVLYQPVQTIGVRSTLKNITWTPLRGWVEIGQLSK